MNSCWTEILIVRVEKKKFNKKKGKIAFLLICKGESIDVGVYGKIFFVGSGFSRGEMPPVF